jgi:tetratricopeptide (TPR) repeat protein
MEKIYLAYPDDVEAALFYALALMGSIQPEDAAALSTRLRAGEIATAVYRNHPNHPGAAHYVIHAYDDPRHAGRALDAARRYATIAPAAPHALHMPSHIFLQLGMWPEAAASNEAAWSASRRWIERKNLPISKRDYHSLHWLLYTYLQQGRYTAAEDLLKVMQQSLAESPTDDRLFMGYGTFTYASMAAAFVIETRRWDLVDTVFKPLQNNTALTTITSNPGPYQALAQYVQALEIFTRGLAKAHQDALDARPSIDKLRKLEQRVGKDVLPGGGLPLVKVLEVQRLEIAAVACATQGDQTEAITLMEKTVALVEQTPPPSGPPPLINPPHELFGQILLRAGQFHKAEEQFMTALRRHPNRARSLLGVARTAAHNGEREKAETLYGHFLRQWQPADGQLTELREARTYGQQTSAQ